MGDGPDRLRRAVVLGAGVVVLWTFGASGASAQEPPLPPPLDELVPEVVDSVGDTITEVPVVGEPIGDTVGEVTGPSAPPPAPAPTSPPAPVAPRETTPPAVTPPPAPAAEVPPTPQGDATDPASGEPPVVPAQTSLTSRPVEQVFEVIEGVTDRAAFPLSLLAVAGVFLLVQDRIDRRDPKLRAAAAEPRPALAFAEPYP